MRSTLTRLSIGMSSALIVLLAGCASSPHVRVDRDPGADLGAYKTFAFLEAPSDAAGYASLVTQQLRRSSRERLEKLGYAYSESNPDLRVNFSLKLADKFEIRSTPGFHGYRGWGSGVQSSAYREGSLRIELVDAGRNAVVWQGVAQGRIDPQATAERIDAAVIEILDRLPVGKSA